MIRWAILVAMTIGGLVVASAWGTAHRVLRRAAMPGGPLGRGHGTRRRTNQGAANARSVTQYYLVILLCIDAKSSRSTSLSPSKSSRWHS